MFEIHPARVMDFSNNEKSEHGDNSMPVQYEVGSSHQYATDSHQWQITDGATALSEIDCGAGGGFATNQYSVTSILNYCKSKLLRPYLRLLSLMGLRPLGMRHDDRLTCLTLFSYLYTIQVIIFMAIGYVLQYMACFRRDRGFGYRSVVLESVKKRGGNDIVDGAYDYERICHGSVMFSYVAPNCLHLVAYLYAVFVFRNSDDDQLPSLMEKVFLSLSNLSDGFVSQKKLVKTLWIFVALSLVWMLLSFLTVNVMMAEGTIDFKWMENGSHKLTIVMKVLLIICTLWHDMIQATVVSNYCLQAQLLTSFAWFLKDKVLQYPVQPVDWMREINEFKKLLLFFNEKLAPAVCIFIVINLSYSISGIFWLLNYDNLDKETVPVLGICILNIILWILITCAPFFQAVRLTKACQILQSAGHEVRGRPFSHQHTPGYKLDSMLLFSSSLKLSAKLFGIPINGKYILISITITCVTLLVLGQLHYLSVLAPI